MKGRNSSTSLLAASTAFMEVVARGAGDKDSFERLNRVRTRFLYGRMGFGYRRREAAMDCIIKLTHIAAPLTMSYDAGFLPSSSRILGKWVDSGTTGDTDLDRLLETYQSSLRSGAVPSNGVIKSISSRLIVVIDQ